MTTANWVTIVGIVLGSNVLISVIQILAGRFRFDRRADQMKSWLDESTVADTLEESAGIHPDQAIVASKTAFAVAVRSDLNSRIALEIVPRSFWSATATLVYSTVGLTLGIVLIEIDENLTVAGVVATSASLLLAVCVVVASAGRGELRALIINRLNGGEVADGFYYRKVGGQMRVLPMVPKGAQARRRIWFTNLRIWIVRSNLRPDLRANVESFLQRVEALTPPGQGRDCSKDGVDPENAEDANGKDAP